MTRTITQVLVSRCLDEAPGLIGEAELANARKCLLDGLAVAHAARGQEGLDILRQVAASSGEPSQAGLMGSPDSVGVDQACLINGMAISVLLFDDNHASMRGHPTAPILPVVMALGEELDLSLDKALRAFVIGYEVESWLGLWFNPSQYEIGWHATATQGTLGATVAAAYLLGLDQEQTRRALGIAGSMLGGVRANFGTMTMSYHSGLAASAGVRAARLAKAGFTANPDILDGPLSIGSALSREWDWDAARASVETICAPFQIVKPGPIFKIYPCGRPTLPGVDCMMELRREHGIRAEDVTDILCEVSFMYPRTLIHPRPKTGLQGKTSLEYCVAAALLDDGPRMSSFTDEAVARPEIARLIDVTRVVVPPHLSEDVPDVRKRPFDQPVTVRVTKRSGDTVSAVVADHRGMPANPATDEDMRHKFIACSEEMFDEARADAVTAYLTAPDASVRGLRALVKG